MRKIKRHILKAAIISGIVASVGFGAVGCSSNKPEETPVETTVTEENQSSETVETNESGETVETTETEVNGETKAEETEANNNEQKPEETKASGTTGGAVTTKPSGNTGGSTNTGGTTTKPTTAPKPSTGNTGGTTHTHNWVAQYKTVNHAAVTHTEKYLDHSDDFTNVREIHGFICRANDSGQCTFKTESYDEMQKHRRSNIEHGGYYTGTVRTEKFTDHSLDEWKTKTVVDKKAWTEKKLTGYKCSGCGATK